jgi:hypothetical protein
MAHRQLDVIVTKITPKKVTYDLFVGGKSEEWRVPKESTFDLSTLQVGTRYTVQTTTIKSNVFNFRKQQTEWQDRYEWVKATRVPMNARSTTKTAKQSEMSKSLASMPLADDGLFQW